MNESIKLTPRHCVLKLLDRLDQTNAYADLLYESEMRRSQYSQLDRALIQEIFYGTVRWRKRLDWIVAKFYQGNYAKAPRFVHYILDSACYQLLFMDKIPAYAAINEAVELGKKKGGKFWASKVNAVLRALQRGLPKIEYPDLDLEPISAIAIRYSHPEWMVARWLKQWGRDATLALCQANNITPQLSIRVNRLKTDPSTIQETLARAGISARAADYLNDFLMVDHLTDLLHFAPFQQGYFSIQDVSAGLACQLLQPQPGERIIDLCAAPGGKAAYIAEMTQDACQIIAVDVNESRLNLVAKNRDRLGLKSLQLIVADGTQFRCEPADRLILDAPCSGLGVLAKRVDLRWKRTPEQIQELTQLQMQLINNAANLIKPGGVLVYCTCTIEPAENQQIVERFLQQRPDFSIEPASRFVPAPVTTPEGYILTLPYVHGMDGSFAVRLRKV